MLNDGGDRGMEGSVDTSSSASSKWNGENASQTDFMESDTVIVVDSNDHVVGSASKKDAHVFSPSQPYGMLHRAFSIFLFDTTTGKLLLQQRAAEKVTFPNVWTNTCCSHPLTPFEVDTPADVSSGKVPGVKHAAIRKLHQELGIPKNQMNNNTVDAMVFVTRLHYWAADTVTHGPTSPWGEHEIDYILFWAVENAAQAITLTPHPEEVQAVRWVSLDELICMQRDATLLFSPWFRLICQRWLVPVWWKNLSGTVANMYADYSTIHEFDPPVEHLGGAGNAGLLFACIKGYESKKQGAYGKIPTHTESKWSQVIRFDEVVSAVTLLCLKPLRSNLDSPIIRCSFPHSDLAFCDEILVKVSRSFAAVIRQLPASLLVDILVFYLVLRALDTIEDDTDAFGGSQEVKVSHLLSFHKVALQDKCWNMTDVGQGDERRLLEEFPKVQSIFKRLSSQSQRIIIDITQRMATGMAEFVGNDLGQGTTDIVQYNRYCHFVAGLVGEGLSRLFAASGAESPGLASELHLSDQMGLFLQKTNIIRDYLEDFVDKRAFWPQSVWKKYAQSGDLGYFVEQSDQSVKAKSIQCLNELVTDALELVPDCLAYMCKLECPEIFRFCAIPQVMAVATLEKCYGNSDVFTGVVKIRKGLSCKLILGAGTLDEVHEIFYRYSTMIQRKIHIDDPNYDRTMRACDAIKELTNTKAVQQRLQRMQMNFVGLVLPITAAWSIFKYNSQAAAASSLAEWTPLICFCFVVPWALTGLVGLSFLHSRTQRQ